MGLIKKSELMRNGFMIYNAFMTVAGKVASGVLSWDNCIYIYMYIYIYVPSLSMYIYIYIEREGEREREREREREGER